MEKINKIIFIKHMNLKLQYISIKLLIELAGKIMIRVQSIARRYHGSYPYRFALYQLYENRKFHFQPITQKSK